MNKNSNLEAGRSVILVTFLYVVLTVLSNMDSEINTASVDTADNKARGQKRSNKENIEPLAAGPLKRVKTAFAVDSEMVRICHQSA